MLLMASRFTTDPFAESLSDRPARQIKDADPLALYSTDLTSSLASLAASQFQHNDSQFYSEGKAFALLVDHVRQLVLSSYNDREHPLESAANSAMALISEFRR